MKSDKIVPIAAERENEPTGIAVPLSKPLNRRFLTKYLTALAALCMLVMLFSLIAQVRDAAEREERLGELINSQNTFSTSALQRIELLYSENEALQKQIDNLKILLEQSDADAAFRQTQYDEENAALAREINRLTDELARLRGE